MKLSDQQIEFALDVAKLIQHINDVGYGCTLGEAYRTPEQAHIYAQEGKGIDDSLHGKRLAIDLNLFSPDGKYLQDSKSYGPFGLFWEDLDPANRWGGNFVQYGGKINDGNHFERREVLK